MSSPARPSYLQSVTSTTLLLLLDIITFPLSFAICTTLALHGLLRGRKRSEKNVTVLVTGSRTTKALIVARFFWKAGYRVVIADEATWGYLSASRFSRCVSRYYNLPDPVTDYRSYEKTIREIVRKENVSLWVPGSSAGGTVSDAKVAEIVRDADGVKAFIQSVDEIEKLHNKDMFGDLCKELGFTVPESVLVNSVEEAVAFLHSGDRQGRKYILKTTALDDQGRSDLTRLPFSWPDKTRAHLQKLPSKITASTPYVLQQYITGYEFCTHCHAIDGVMQSFLTCPSNDMLMRYMDCRTAFSQRIAEDAENWTRELLARWKAKLDKEGKKYHLTGHFSFDFIVETDGTLYPIECNPRIHTAIVLLSGLKAETLAASYFGHKENGLLEPVLTARERYSWTFHSLPIAIARAVLPTILQRKLHPLLAQTKDVDALAPSIPVVTVSPPAHQSLMEVLMDYMTGAEKDPLFDLDDPMPFVAQHLMWLWLLGRLVFTQGKGWSRVNVSTSRLFSC